MTQPKAILVIGAGDATGGAIARRFARDGYIACLTHHTADAYRHIHQQPRDAWTHETELRPWIESW